MLTVENELDKPKGDIKPTYNPPRGSSKLQKIKFLFLDTHGHTPLHRTPSPFQKYFDAPSLFRARTRFFLMILVLLCLASIWSNILCFNFAVICIDPQEEGEENENNSEKENEMPDLLRPPITMAVAAGALVANFPAVYLVGIN